jgi:hypothetical protein
VLSIIILEPTPLENLVVFLCISLGFSSSEDNNGSFNSRHYPLDLPSGEALKGLTLQVISYKNGKILNQSFFPVERLSKETHTFHNYIECLPDTTYSNKIVQYSRDAENLIK